MPESLPPPGWTVSKSCPVNESLGTMKRERPLAPLLGSGSVRASRARTFARPAIAIATKRRVSLLTSLPAHTAQTVVDGEALVTVGLLTVITLHRLGTLGRDAFALARVERRVVGGWHLGPG